MTSRPLSHAELIVLGLLEGDAAHAYELVHRIRDMRVDRWARVAESTVYAVLRRLEDGSLVSGEDEPGERSAPRRRYRLTSRGRQELEALVRRGLEQPGILYSDRIVAGVVAAGLTGAGFGGADPGAADLLKLGLERTEMETEALEAGLTVDGLSEEGRIILEFYRDLARAHERALKALGRTSAP